MMKYIPAHGIYGIGIQAMGFMGQDVEVLTIIPVESEIGGQPNITAVVLDDLIDESVGESILRADELHLPIVIRLGGERRAKGKES